MCTKIIFVFGKFRMYDMYKRRNKCVCIVATYLPQTSTLLGASLETKIMDGRVSTALKKKKKKCERSNDQNMTPAMSPEHSFIHQLFCAAAAAAAAAKTATATTLHSRGNTNGTRCRSSSSRRHRPLAQHEKKKKTVTDHHDKRRFIFFLGPPQTSFNKSQQFVVLLLLLSLSSSHQF